MKLISAIAVTLVGAILTGCSSGAPMAPLGLDKRPANPPTAEAPSRASGEHTPTADGSVPITHTSETSQ